MARYAKNAADRHRSPGRSNNPASLLADALASTSGSSSYAKFNVEKGFASNFPTQEARNGVRKPGFVRSPSAQLMPPPPPRHSAVLSTSNPGTSENWVESPPKPSMLMHSKIVKIAAITDPETKEISNADMLGKSVDSSVVPFPILRKSSKEGAYSDELVVPAPQRRVRAESYDERKVKFAATVTSRHYYTAPQEEHFMVPDPLSAKNTGRPRSVSCGNMEHKRNPLTPSNNFDTIAEGEEHEEVFEMN